MTLKNDVLAELVLQDGTVLEFIEPWQWRITGTKPVGLPAVNIDPHYADWEAYVERVVEKLNPVRFTMIQSPEPPGELGVDYVY